MYLISNGISFTTRNALSNFLLFPLFRNIGAIYSLSFNFLSIYLSIISLSSIYLLYNYTKALNRAQKHMLLLLH